MSISDMFVTFQEHLLQSILTSELNEEIVRKIVSDNRGLVVDLIFDVSWLRHNKLCADEEEQLIIDEQISAAISKCISKMNINIDKEVFKRKIFWSIDFHEERYREPCARILPAA